MQKKQFYKDYPGLPRRPVVIFSDRDETWPTIAIATPLNGHLAPNDAVTNLQTLREQIQTIKEGLDGEFFVMGSDKKCDHLMVGKNVSPVHVFVEKNGEFYTLYDSSWESRFPHFIVVKGK